MIRTITKLTSNKSEVKTTPLKLYQGYILEVVKNKLFKQLALFKVDLKEQ